MSDLIYQVSDSAGGEFRLQISGSDFQLYRDNTLIESNPLASVDSFTINGGDGNETLLIDGLIALPGGIFFNGGLPNTPPGDGIKIAVSSLDTATITFTSATDGAITLASGSTTATYNFTGVDPIDMTGSTVTDLVFNLPGGTNTELEDDGTAGDNILQLRDTLGGFDTTTFARPTGSLTINGTGTDNVNVNSFDDLVIIGLTINANTTTFTSPNAIITLASLTTDAAGTTAINNGGITTTGVQTYHDAVTLGANALLTSTGSGAITFDSTVDNGGFDLEVSTGGVGTFSGAISGSGKFIQSGSGITTLGGTNTYTGATTVSGGTLKAGAAGAFASGSAFVVDATLDLGGLNETIGSLAGSGTVTNNGVPATLTAGGDGTSTLFSGVIQDGAVSSTTALTKTGAGILTLSGTNAHSGGTTISGGTLSTSADANLGAASAGLTLSGGTWQATASYTATRNISVAGASGIDVTGSSKLTLSGTISSVTGGVTKTGTGTLLLNGTGYEGAITIAAGGGTLSLAGAALTGTANIFTLGSVIDYANGENNPSTITISSDTTQLQVTVGSATQSGKITQDAPDRGFEKIGAGTLVINNNTNDYSGTTTLTAGMIQIGADHALGTGTLAMANGTTLQAGVANLSLGNDITLAAGSETIDANGHNTSITGAVTGSGTLNVSNSAGISSPANVTLSNTSNAISTLGTVSLGTGAFTLNNTGVLAIVGAATAGGGYSVIADGGALTQNVGAIIDTSGVSSDGDITLKATGGFPTGYLLTLNANLNAGPTGSVNLAGDAGVAQVAGTITAGSVDAVALAGSVSLISASNSFGIITGAGNGGFTAVSSRTLSTGPGGVTSGFGDISLTATGVTSDVNITMEAGIAAQTGTTKLTAGQNITIDAGVESTALELSAPGLIAVNVALGDITHPISITVNATGTASFNDVIAGTGTFTQSGIGTTTLAAINTYSGATTVTVGTLLVDGSSANSTTTVNGGTLGGHGTTGAVIVNSGGHLAPGNSAGLLITGDLSMSSGSTLDEEIGGATPGSGYDQVQVHGSVSLGGATLNITQINSFFVSGADTDNFIIIDNDGTGDAVTGTFAGLAEGASLTIGSGTFLITYQGGDGNDVVLLAANDVPSLNGLGDTAFYTENAAGVVLDTSGNASVSDAELNEVEFYAGATLMLARHGGANPDDVFGGTGTGAGQLDLTHSNGIGENVSLNGGSTFIGTFTQSGDGTFTITFNANAFANDVAQVLRNISYANASDNPPASVEIDFTFSDGNGQPGGQDQGLGAAPGIATGIVTVEITQVNDAPVLVNVAPFAAYGIGTAGAVLSPALGVFDADATPPSPLTGVNSATITIANGFLATDQLFVNLLTDSGHFITPDGETTNITLQSDASGTLMLVGQDTISHWQIVLDAVSYRSSAVDPTNGGSNPNRTITWVVNDGALDSQTPNTDPDFLLNATILHFANPPSLDLDSSGAGTGFTASYTENGAPIRIADTDVAILDTDSAALASATVVLTNASAGDVLSIAGALPEAIGSSIDTSIAGRVTLSLTGSATLADYQTALGQVRFASSSEEPDSTDRDITVVVSDGEVDSNTAHATVHVVSVNDAPVITAPVGNPAAIGVLEGTVPVRMVTATDVDGPSISYSIVGGADAGKFEIDASTGLLRFIDPPSFDSPTDADHNNHYLVTVRASDGTLFADQAIDAGVFRFGHPEDAVVRDVDWLGSEDVGTYNSAWQVAGIGDFNGDGSSDVLWRNPLTGAVDEWRMADGQWQQSINLGTHGTNWQAAGIGDFNGDHTDDVLWRNPTTGQVDIWIMSGGQWAQSKNLGTLGVDWHVLGVGDFNGDSTSDILLQNQTSGQIQSWGMLNGQFVGVTPLGSYNPAWDFAGIGDANNDGVSDVFWHNAATGQVDEWQMANGNWSQSIDVGSFDPAFHLEEINDFNGDGNVDILWRHPITGEVVTWNLNGGHRVGSSSLGSFNPNFRLEGSGDFNHAGGADLLWHNPTTGQVHEWLLGQG